MERAVNSSAVKKQEKRASSSMALCESQPTVDSLNTPTGRPSSGSGIPFGMAQY
jgi:hypothetical protein